MAPVDPSTSQPDGLRNAAAGFTQKDWVCRPDFLPAGRTEALRHECRALHEAGRFHAAGIGREAVRQPAVRGDEILWVEDQAEWAPQAARLLRDEFSRLREAINAETFLGLQDFEGHYAIYPAGARYARHVDRFKSDSRRVISVVLYLNEDWSAGDGGELCLYRDLGDAHAAMKITPEGGTLVCFLSDAVPHEVLQARRSRLSLTGWFRRRA
ncbi:MAG TPA: 2OG-Fe(II) oxygenase [Gammaproteobacteria bacterium]|jgi:SM-20-related protein|nr:2OG-Fe(II) oxygenase [Gammaproteobacteria bacterium]